MAVLAHLGDQNARPAPFFRGKGIDPFFQFGKVVVALNHRSVGSRDEFDLRLVAAEDFFHGIGDLSDAGPLAGRLDTKAEQVLPVIFACRGDRGKRLLAGRLVAFGTHLLEAGDLRLAHRRVVDIEDLDRVFLGQFVLVDPDNHVAAAVDRRLFLGRRFLDTQLRHTGFDRLGHAPQRFDLVEDLLRFFNQRCGQRLDVVGTGERVDHVADAGLLLDHQLGVAGDARRMIGRQGDRFVEGVGVQRLGAAEDRGHRFDGSPDDVVVGVLLGEAPPRGLAVSAQHQRPEIACGAQFRGLHEEVHADGEEE